jgi:putative endonuclease
MLSKNKSSYKSGLFAEWRARWFLRFNGFKILKSRYVTGRNTNRAEIDIIAKRKNLIIFLEVKKRETIECAFDAITSKQSTRLRMAAENYLAKKTIL